MSDQQAPPAFGPMMKMLLERSGMTKDELSEKIDVAGCPADSGGAAPTIILLETMIDILKPTGEEEMDLYRAVLPLFNVDQSKPFGDMAKVCRRAAGLTMHAAGKKYERKFSTEDGIPSGSRIALFESGKLMPSQDEGRALADIYLVPEHEYSLVTNKIAATMQSGIQVVKDDFVATAASPTEADIEEAARTVADEEGGRQKSIIASAAEILMAHKSKE